MRWAERDRSGGEKYSQLTRALKAGLHSFSLSKLIGRKLSGPVWQVGEWLRWRKWDGCRLKFREERLNTRLVEERYTKGRTKDANDEKHEKEKEKNKNGRRLKKSKLEGGTDRGTVAHRHAIMWRLGLIYTRVRRKHTTESQSRGRKRKRLRWYYLSEGVSILIGSLPLFQPGVPVLEFVSSAEDYGESETGIISRNKVTNYPRRNFDS